MNNLIELADKIVNELNTICVLCIQDRRTGVAVGELGSVIEAARAYAAARLANQWAPTPPIPRLPN